MSKIETKLEALKSLLDPLLTSASPQKKKYAKDLFSEIITELNKAELNNELLKAKLNGFINTNEYSTNYEKAIDILILMGAGDVPYDFLTKRNMRWICEHNEDQKQPFTFIQLYKTERMLKIFEGLEDRLPESLNELKEFFKNE